jgi:hypothetical protein
MIGVVLENCEYLESLDLQKRQFQSVNSTFSVRSFMYTNHIILYIGMVRIYMFFTPFTHTLMCVPAGNNAGIIRKIR